MMGNKLGLCFENRNKTANTSENKSTPAERRSSNNEINAALTTGSASSSPKQPLISRSITASPDETSLPNITLHLNSKPFVSPAKLSQSSNSMIVTDEEEIEEVTLEELTDNVDEAIKILRNADILLSRNLIQELHHNPQYAIDIAVALLLLHKCDIPMTEVSISNIADAGPRAMELAEQIVWFTTHIDSSLAIINLLTDALVRSENITNSVSAIAIISCITSLTAKLIYSIARAQKVDELLNTVLSLKKNGVNLTEENILALAQAKMNLREILAININTVNDELNQPVAAVKKAEIMGGLLQNSILYGFGENKSTTSLLTPRRSAVIREAASARFMQLN